MDTQLFLPGSALWHEQQARNRAEIERAHLDALQEKTRRARAREYELARQQKLAKRINPRTGRPPGVQGHAVAEARVMQSRIELLTKIELAKQRIGTAEDMPGVRARVIRAHARMTCTACHQPVQHHVGKLTVERGLRGAVTVYAPILCPECGHVGEIVVQSH